MRAVRRLAGAAATATGWLVGAVVLACWLLNIQTYVITGGSLSGTIERGSLVFGTQEPVEELAVGHLITYVPPATSGITGPVTHRIHELGKDSSGVSWFRTKGDANRSADPWRFTLPDHATHARVRFSVPLVGYAVAALSLRPVRMLVLGLPALLIGLSVARTLWRDPEPRPA